MSKKECKHENEHRSYLKLIGAEGNGWRTELWYRCSECSEEARIELKIANEVINFTMEAMKNEIRTN